MLLPISNLKHLLLKGLLRSIAYFHKKLTRLLRLQWFSSLLAIVMVANDDAPKKDSLSCHWSCHSLSQGGGQTRFCSTANTFISWRHYITDALHYTTLHHIILHCAALRVMSVKNGNTCRLCYVQPFYSLAPLPSRPLYQGNAPDTFYKHSQSHLTR